MMDCKRALSETQGDLEGAVDWLRKKGLAAAAKKAGRVAAEGLIGLAADGHEAALVEVNSETDFVARNATFQHMASAIAKTAIGAKGNLDKLMNAKFPGDKATVADTITEMIGTIGENMALRRTAFLSVKNGTVASYMHNTMAPGLGKIGVIVALESKGDANKLAAFGKQLAMHIAAANPQAVDVESLDKNTIARERAVLTEQAKESGKPAPVIEKMVEGRLRKFYGTWCCWRKPSCTIRRRRSRTPWPTPRRRPARRSRSPASTASRLAKGSSARATRRHRRHRMGDR
jgi:elongation factor Ts